MTVNFAVYGVPQPKGSTRAFVRKGRAIVTADNPRGRPWAALVADAARQVLGPDHRGPGAATLPFPAGVAVVVGLRFILPRPRSLPKRVRFQTHRPDLDKLVRAVLDPLTGLLWADDGQVVDVSASKHFGLVPGLYVFVTDVTDTEGATPCPPSNS